MEVIAWFFVIGMLLLAIVGVVRAKRPQPDDDVRATHERIAERRRDTELAATQAAQLAKKDVEREFP